MKLVIDSSQRRKAKLSRSFDTEKAGTQSQGQDTNEVKRYMDEEEMLDIAEHCFIRMAEMMLQTNRSARSIFTKYSIPEQFPDGTILELMSPIAFLEGAKEAGMDDLSEMEAACLLRVLAKPELENAIILNEFVMIMENFGVIDGDLEDDDEDDYVPDDDDAEESKSKISATPNPADTPKNKEEGSEKLKATEKEGNQDK